MTGEEEEKQKREMLGLSLVLSGLPFAVRTQSSDAAYFLDKVVLRLVTKVTCCCLKFRFETG